MKVSYSWLKDFVDVNLSPEKLAEKLTMAGLSVAGLEAVGGDHVFDIEVTSNRPDWLSLRGVAREVAAVTGGKLKKNTAGPQRRKRASTGRAAGKSGEGSQMTGAGKACFSIRIDDAKDCALYCGSLITGVKVGPSPQEMRRRLEAAGLRSVNNVVDITNYCLMEFGQPLHAFDFRKIRHGAIVVRRAKKGEGLVLLDGSREVLTPEVLVIADAVQPIAAAGIMGGLETEVSSQTVDVLLESACFNPAVVRRGARCLGVSSDASYRFERGVDLAGVTQALEAATRMILDLCGGTLAGAKRAGRATAARRPSILFSLDESRDVLGLDLSGAKVKAGLEKLGFKVKKKKGELFEVEAPAFRRDVRLQEDLTEEVARICGYDEIPLTTPQIRPFLLKVPKAQALKPKIRDLLVCMGLKEAVAYSLVCDEDYRKSGQSVPEGALALENPLSQEYSVLRTTVVPSLLSCVSFNASRGNKDLEIFELTRLYDTSGERSALGIALAGERRASWLKESRPHTIFDLKGILENVLVEFQVKDFGFTTTDAAAYFERGAAGEIVCAGQSIARFGQISEGVKKSWGIKGSEDIFVAEVDVGALADFSRPDKAFAPIASVPVILRDISALVPQAASFRAIQDAILAKGSGYVQSVRLAERYQGKEIPSGFTGLTIAVVYGSPRKTLTDEEVGPVHQAVLDALVRELGLTLR